MRLPAVLALATLVACSGKKDAEPSTQPAEVGQLVRSDAGITAVVTAVDPNDRHVDVDGIDRPVYTHPSTRGGRPIDITLRSSPPGAEVAVDGTVLGDTPAYWRGMADGKEHEFVFTMRGHAIARYRFVPVSSGVIHGRLDRIHEERDAGAGTPPPEVVPPQPPASPSANRPIEPPTLVAPSADALPTPDAIAPIPAPVPGTTAPAPSIGPEP